MGFYIITIKNCLNLFLKPLQGLLMVISVKLLTTTLWKTGFNVYMCHTIWTSYCICRWSGTIHAYRLAHLSHPPHDEGNLVPVCIAEVLYIQGNPHPSQSASPVGTFPTQRVLALHVKLMWTTDWLGPVPISALAPLCPSMCVLAKGCKTVGCPDPLIVYSRGDHKGI